MLNIEKMTIVKIIKPFREHEVVFNGLLLESHVISQAMNLVLNDFRLPENSELVTSEFRYLDLGMNLHLKSVDDYYVLLMVDDSKDLTTLLNRFSLLSNEQANNIREMYKKFNKQIKEFNIFEELVMVNNALITERRQNSILQNHVEHLESELIELRYTDPFLNCYTRQKFYDDLVARIISNSTLYFIEMENIKHLLNEIGYEEYDRHLSSLLFMLKGGFKASESLYKINEDLLILCSKRNSEFDDLNSLLSEMLLNDNVISFKMHTYFVDESFTVKEINDKIIEINNKI